MMATANAIDGRLDALEAKADEVEALLDGLLALRDAQRNGDKERVLEAKATLREILDGEG